MPSSLLSAPESSASRIEAELGLVCRVVQVVAQPLPTPVERIQAISVDGFDKIKPGREANLGKLSIDVAQQRRPRRDRLGHDVITKVHANIADRVERLGVGGP